MKIYRMMAAAMAAVALASCASNPGRMETAANVEIVPAPVLAKHDYSLADTPNKRTALAYLYTAWNERDVAGARLTYWVKGSFPGLERGEQPKFPPGFVHPSYTIKKVIEEDDHVTVLAFVEGIGVGKEFTTVFGTPGGTKIGDAVVEIFRFADNGLIAEKWDTIEALSEKTYDFE